MKVDGFFLKNMKVANKAATTLKCPLKNGNYGVPGNYNHLLGSKKKHEKP